MMMVPHCIYLYVIDSNADGRGALIAIWRMWWSGCGCELS